MIYDLDYICEKIQKGHIKPSKYRHFLKIPLPLFNMLNERLVIIPNEYFAEESAFFQYNTEEVTINFINKGLCNDLHIKILSYLVSDLYGNNPIIRGGIMF